jgi:hypothetical protein
MRTLLIIISFIFGGISFAEQSEAILILGSDLGLERRNSHIDELNRISSFLIAKNVVIHEFYDDEAKWDNIIKISPRCSFFIYFGHGGMKNFLKMNGDLIDSNKIISELRLKPNSLVLLGHSCFSAGSSSSDFDQISLSTANDRIKSRASVFFKTGASVYYSNNFNDGILSFLSNLYRGNSIQQYHDSFISGGLFKVPSISMNEDINSYYSGNLKIFLFSDIFFNHNVRTYDICIIADPNFRLF